MIKYYYNDTTKSLCIDTNEYTPYLKDRGYREVTKEFYDEKVASLERMFEELKGDDNGTN